MRSLVVVLLVVVPMPAGAEPDLRLHHQPLRLQMRPKQVATTPPPPTNPTPSAAPAPPHVDAPTSFAALPTSSRDLAERVILHVNAGVELDHAGASGDPQRGGVALASGFSGSRPWIVGDAIVGMRDLLVPSLGGYLLSSYQFDTSNAIPSQSALVVPGDATDQRIAIKAGYVEWNVEPHDRAVADHGHVWLRGGRQFRLDGGSMFAYFDGVTAGWRDPVWNVSAFAGRRVALFVDTSHGTSYGATAAIDLAKQRDLPLQLALDVQGLAIETVASTAQVSSPPAPSTLENRMLVAVTAHADLSRRLELDARLRFVDGGAGLGFGRVGLRARFAPDRHLLVIGDLEQRGRGDLAYDLSAPSAVDVVDVSRRLGVGLAAPIAATTVGGRIDYRATMTELLAFARVEIPESEITHTEQQGWLEVGAAVARPIFGVFATAQYTLRQYFLDQVGNLQGVAFDNTSGSGVSRLHEVAVDLTHRIQTGGGRRWRFGTGVFYRHRDLASPYVTVDFDGRVGARGDVQWWFTRQLHAELAAEVATSSPTLARDLGTLSSVRLAVEAQW